MATLRNYITAQEIETITNGAVASGDVDMEVLALIEMMIDDYVGYVHRFTNLEYIGQATDGTTTTVIDTSGDSPLSGNDGYFERMVIEVISGTNAGESRHISGYDASTQTLTVTDAFASAIDSTSVYKIYQLGKFPRRADYRTLENVYYKTIPRQVKEAVAYQYEFYISKGDIYFTKNMGDFQSEEIDDYTYDKGDGSTSLGKSAYISTKSKQALRGVMSIVGQVIR